MLASLDARPEARDDEAWVAEIERRGRAALAAEPGLSWPDTLEKIEGRLGRDRK